MFRYIAVSHKDDGILESHVYVMNVPAVEFEVVFTLANLENAANSIHIGTGHFSNRTTDATDCVCEENREAVTVCNGDWGGDFCPVGRLTESSSGFLKSGFFVIVMNMKIKADENEHGDFDTFGFVKEALDGTHNLLELVKTIMSS